MIKKILLFVLGTVAVGSLAANLLLYKRYSNQRTLVRVGEDTITRKEYQDAVDFKYGYGKQTMQKLVFAKVIAQAAQKAGVTPTEADVTKRINELKQTRNEVQLALTDPGRMAELRKSVAADLAFENLRIRNISVTDKEVRDFYNNNQSAFKTPTQTSGMVVLAKNSVDADTAAEMMRRKMKPEVIARQPRLGVVGVGGFTPDLAQLPAEDAQRIQEAVFHAKTGTVVTVPLVLDRKPLYVLYRPDKQTMPTLLPLTAVKDKIARALRLHKAPSQIDSLAKIYKEAHVTFEADSYKAFFSDLEVAQNTNQ